MQHHTDLRLYFSTAACCLFGGDYVYSKYVRSIMRVSGLEAWFVIHLSLLSCG